MNGALDREFLGLVAGVLAVLVVASIVGAILARRVTSDSARATIANLNNRIRACLRTFARCPKFHVTK